MATRPITRPEEADGVLAIGGPPPREDIVRAITPGFELRAADEKSGGDLAPIMYGHFSVFNEWSLIDSAWEGLFYERSAPGCFTKTFSENMAAIRCLYQHGRDGYIGMKVLGRPSVLVEDEIGAYYEVPLLHETQYVQELLPGLRAKLYGMSYRFTVLQDEYVQHPRRSEHNPRGLPERTLTEVRVREFGPCTFGQYDEPNASIRSATDEFMLERLAEDPARLERLVARTGIAVPRAIPSRSEQDSEEAALPQGGLVPAGDVVPALLVPGDHVLNPAQVEALTAALHENAEQGGAMEDDETPAATEPEEIRDEDREGARERSYERAITLATDTVWAIRPDKLDMIVKILDERARGIRLTPEEIRERIGEEPERAEQPSGSAVQVLPMYGTIMPRGEMFSDVSGGGGTSVQSFSRRLKEALADPAVKGILMDIDSPGGSADLVEELAGEIRSAVQKGTKPIWAVANTDANSAAYWLGSQAGELAVTPSGSVGSIGVYIAHRDISAQEAKEGVKTTLIKAGKYKAETSPYEPLSKEATAALQDRVDTTYAKFVRDVAAGRGVKTDIVLSDFGQGRVMDSEQALEAGMVDTVETYPEMLARMEKLVGRGTIASTDDNPLEPDPSEDTTPEGNEPEPSEATTQEGGDEVPPDAEPEPSAATTPPQPSPEQGEASDTPQPEETAMTLVIDELRARQTEVQTRLTNIHNEFGSDLLPEEIRQEWAALMAERETNTERIKEYEQRERMLHSFAEDDLRAEPTFGLPSRIGSNAGRRGPKNLFAVEEYRAHFGRSPEELASGFRDGAMHAVDAAYFPQDGISREDAQAQVARLLDRDSEDSEIARRILSTGSPEYMRAFGKYIAGKPLTNEEQRALSTTGSEGGVGVPYTLDPTVIDTSNGVVNPIRRVARNITIAGSNEWRGVSSSGVTASYSGEADEVDDDSPTFDQPVINVERADVFVPFSYEIGGDFGGLQGEIATMMAYAKDELEAEKFVTGLGHAQKQPEGFITALAAIPGSVVTSDSVNAFIADDVYALEEDLGPRFRALAQFVGNRAIYNKVRRFANSNNEADMWVRDLSVGLNNNATGNTGATLIGYAANELSEMDSVVHGGNEILVFGDFRHYAVVDRVGMTVEYIQNLMGPTGRPTGQRGLLSWWRNSAGVLAPEAFRLLVVASS